MVGPYGRVPCLEEGPGDWTLDQKQGLAVVLKGYSLSETLLLQPNHLEAL